ncbi:spartin isoform X1 [Neopsephotus bourkii]|uniref:spartin isoform X1 n=1 Tax=Neopsephotus bourkii TaxID=309878 RepID=UPI002AA5BD63|nr:spartin isoform X1 [Neopsephotus bourkii]XP_061201446.1 spartin isoform X1 [Neopsephotus bourkii]
MEQLQDPVMQEDANIKAINEEYKKAFFFINKGLNTDELGQKEEARTYYKQGLDHLLQGISIPSQGPACVGSQWESARQMQQKMRETLQNVHTRLGILEQNTPPVQASPAVMDAPDGVPRLYPSIPSKEKPERPPAPNSLLVPSQPPAADGSVAAVSPAQIPGMSPSAKPLCLPNEAPPAYTPQATNGHFTVSYGTDSGEFSSVSEDYYSKCTQPPPLENLGVDADELILIPQGVQIFFVTPDGQVSAPSYPGYLRIVKFLDTESETAQNRPPAFLQVCDWLYPLMCNQSPVLCCNTGVYMFPDTMSQIPGSYVGLVLSSELPAADRGLFEDLLKQMSDLRIQVPGSHERVGFSSELPATERVHFEDKFKQMSGHKVQPSDTSGDAINLSQTVRIEPQPEGAENRKELPEWSEKIAHGILSGASWVSWGLIKGAEYTGKAIHKGASKLREHIQPEEKPLEVNPTVAKGLHVAKQATGGAVKVSQFLVEGVCSIASCVGKELAPHVKKHGSKLVPESLKKDKDGKSTLDGALVVAASGVQGNRNPICFFNCIIFSAVDSNKLIIFTGFSTVWQGLESAAKCIAKSVSTETVKTVKYKYGDDAGHATDNAMNSAINVGVTAFNIDNIGIKAVVKRTAKETGHAVLDEYKVLDNKKKDKK